MRAVTFSSYGPAEVLTLTDLPVPEPGPGQVRVRVAATSVNPADWRTRSGQLRRVVRIALPFVPGTDVAGVVDAVGAQVSQVRPGDPVLAVLPARAGGSYAEMAVVAADAVVPAPAGVPLGDAAALPLCGLTALQALRRAEVQPGHRLLVHGASGGVGTLAVQIGRALGAEVTAVTSAESAELVTGLGVARVLDRTRDDLAAEAGRYDAVLDATNHLPLRRAAGLLRPGGAAVSVNPVAGLRFPDWLAWTRGGRRLRSIIVKPVGADLRTVAEWVAAGTVRPVVQRTYRLAEAVEAHRHSESGRVRGKLVLVVDEQLAATVPGA